MKKSWLALPCVLLALAACEADTPTGTGDTTLYSADSETETGETGVDTDTGAFTSMVFAVANGTKIGARSISEAYKTATGAELSLVKDLTAEPQAGSPGEIVLGATNRAVSAEAQARLEAYLTEHGTEWDTVSYIIYMENGSVALYWDSDASHSAALSALIERLTAENFVMTDGYEEVVTMRITEEKRKDEQASREQALSLVAEQYNQEIADAVADHLAIANEDFYLWMAALYEPRQCVCETYDESGCRVCQLPVDEDGSYLCHGGGFYYSNSARDTDGYDIDLESTKQALCFLRDSGMLAEYGGEMIQAIPRQMQNDIVAFVRSLQDPEDGYFYHPQWGKDITTSRRGRDLSWATQLLEMFDAKPFWDTPNGVAGEYGAPGQVSTVSVKTTASTTTTKWVDHLATVKAFEAYLDTFDWANDSYSSGNTLSAEAAQIKARDKEGLANGEFVDADGDGIADNGLIAAFERYMNAAQNAENGLWEDSVHYNSVNGLMKISMTYNSLGIRLPHAEEAFASAAEMAMLAPETADSKGKLPKNSVDVYNPWVAISGVLTNVSKYGDETTEETLRSALLENAAAMIRTTTAKTKKFVKDDGSYGYTWTTSPAKSQGASAAVPGTVEGDINGGTIAVWSTWNHMSLALGIKVPMYYPSDFDTFIHALTERTDLYA